MNAEPTENQDAERDERVAQVVAEVLSRRAGGEEVTDDAIVQAHPELMPDLAEKMRALRLVEEAEELAQTPVESASDSTASVASPAVANIPRRIGQFHINKVLASGGMGTVYEATQEHPRRSVAIKMMRRGITSRSALRRFEYEAQILGRLRHPHIAQIYEAGTHDDGAGPVPYFAMEYIPDAKLLTHYARENKLGTRQRLELFIQICGGIHYGHQRGVIHRDLKPGNILVDADGLAKIIDFGVARSTDADMAVTTLHTDVGQLVGTLQYMSPEQCAGDVHDIDTRSDVYALGVVLYELLCDARPYEVGTSSLYEAIRVIQEQPPPKLSRLDRALRGDIETICLKALEKERERRYQSVAALAEDIERYLTNQPILARSPSAAYQLSKLVARHKAPFALLATLFVVVVAFAVWMGVLYSRADTNLTRALAAEEEAGIEAETATRTRDFLVELFAINNPSEMRGNAVTARELLDKGARTIREELQDQPKVQATLMNTLGTAYSSLGLFDNAEDLLEATLAIRQQELPEQQLDIAATSSDLAMVQLAMGNLVEAERLSRQALAIYRDLFGNKHVDVATCLNNLATVFDYRADYNEAARLHRDALKMRQELLGTSHIDVATSMINLAYSLQNKGDIEQAEPLYRQALAIRRRQLGDDHLDVAMARHYLATLLHYNKREFDEAGRLYDLVLDAYQEHYREDHPNMAALLTTYAALLQDTGDLDRAEQSLRKALAMNRKLLGDEHERVAGDLNTLAAVLRDKGDLGEAERLHHQALALRRKLLGNENPYVGVTLTSLGTTLTKMGRYEAAEDALKEAHAILNVALPDGNRQTIDTLERLVTLYQDWGKPEQAAQYRAMLPGGSDANDKQ